jgi:cytochrome c oxidase assembly protein subunit 15
MAILKDWRFVQSGMSSGLPGAAFTAAMKHPIAKRFRAFSWGLTALVFATALSGACANFRLFHFLMRKR